METNIKVVNRVKGDIGYISIQELSEIMLRNGMTKGGFFRFCFQLIGGSVFVIEEIEFMIKSDFELNRAAMTIVDQLLIDAYQD